MTQLPLLRDHDPAAEFMRIVRARRADPALDAVLRERLRGERERLLAAKRRWHRAVVEAYEELEEQGNEPGN